MVYEEKWFNTLTSIEGITGDYKEGWISIPIQCYTPKMGEMIELLIEFELQTVWYDDGQMHVDFKREDEE